MRIGVISDTHGVVDNNIFNLFEDVDLVFHAGDFGSVQVLTELETIAPVRGVHGNVDNFELVSQFPMVNKVSLAGFKIVISHDIGRPERPYHDISELIRSYHPDMVIFGHSHVPFNKVVEDVLFFNPGSASSGRQGYGEYVGILEISSKEIRAIHLEV